LIIPFDARFEEGGETDDPNIFEKLTTPEALEYWVLCGLKGLKRLIDNKGRHTYCARIEEARKARRHGADNIAAWIDENNLDAKDFIGQRTVDMYGKYEEYCKEDEDAKPKSRKVFVSHICSSFRLKSVQRRDWTGRNRYFEEF
jgi:putative DNA primase/helicase